MIRDDIYEKAWLFMCCAALEVVAHRLYDRDQARHSFVL